MPDVEKTVNGLESLYERLLDAAKRDSIAMLDAIIVSDALALLKAQEPVAMAGAELTDAELIEEIQKAPIVLEPNVDAAPVVHGRWIDENPDDSLDPRMRCSICTGVESPLIKWRYCPNCGAKMDGERRDEHGKADRR